MRLVYPRLPTHVARTLLQEREGLSIPDLVGMSSVSHPDQTWIATGGARVSQQRLSEIQVEVRRLAVDHGYPGSSGARASGVGFDKACAARLHEMMEIVPADAASEGVWAFLGCVLLPDVACWRFPDRTAERLLGHPRNVFRRLWWRSHVLDAKMEGGTPLVQQLGEDEIVQVMERPTLAGNPRVARAICQSFLAAAARGGQAQRMDLMRDAAKRLIRLTPFIVLDVLDDDALRKAVGGAFSASLTALGAGPVP